jgi:alkylhydroperoxidase family enzyme
MSIFTPDEIEYLGSGFLGRLATVGPDGTPHIAPVGMISYNPHLDAMDICRHVLTNTKKFRDAARTGNPQKLSQPIPGRCLYVEAKRNPGGDMASNTRIPKAELSGIYGAMVKRMSRKMLGDVAEPVEVAWHNRKVLNFSFSLGRKAQKWDQCDENLKSFAHMAVASLVGCSFCLDLGYFQAHNEGLDETKAREVPRWRESDVFTPLERDVMEYAEAMSLTPPTVTDELSARLLDQLGAPALVELTAFIALANLYTRTNTAFGIESQEFSAACDLKPLAVPSTT